MQDKHLFEYAIVRVVPRVEREEFINVGIILYCPSLRFLKMIYHLNASKILTICGDMDVHIVEAYLQALDRTCQGGRQGGIIGQLPIASRFRWLTATRSSVVQTSRVHPGFCTDADLTLTHLVDQLVL